MRRRILLYFDLTQLCSLKFADRARLFLSRFDIDQNITHGSAYASIIINAEVSHRMTPPGLVPR
jgi:hypothetical protein